MRPRLRIFTWHVHGSYLWYLSHVPHTFYVPVDATRSPGHCGRTRSYPWPDNLIEVPVEEVPRLEFDCLLYQSERNFRRDQFDLLTPWQREVPKLYLEHDPPRQHPTDTKHPVQTREVSVVHVTAFNRLMWDCGEAETCVVDHGVTVPETARATCELERGITVVNNLALRGRRLGADLFEHARREVPLDLVGMESAALGGLGEVPHGELPAFLSSYRFFYNPIRYTSLGLAILEAMAVGLPIVGLATTELATVFADGEAGFLDTRPEALVPRMHELLRDRALALRLGAEARRIASERFGLRRFVADWMEVFDRAASTGVRGPFADNPPALSLP